MERNTNITKEIIEGTPYTISRVITYQSVKIDENNKLDSYDSVEFDDKMQELILGKNVGYYIYNTKYPEIKSAIYDSITYDKKTNSFEFKKKYTCKDNKEQVSEFKIIFNADINGTVKEIFNTGENSKWRKIQVLEPDNVLSPNFSKNYRNLEKGNIITSDCFYKCGIMEYIEEVRILDSLIEGEETTAIKLYSNDRKSLTPPVINIEYDKENNVYNITDIIWLNSNDFAYLYYSINGYRGRKDDYKPVGFAYTNVLDSFQIMNIDINDINSYNEFKYHISKLINKESKDRILNHKENQLKFIRCEKRD